MDPAFCGRELTAVFSVRERGEFNHVTKGNMRRENLRLFTCFRLNPKKKNGIEVD